MVSVSENLYVNRELSQQREAYRFGRLPFSLRPEPVCHTVGCPVFPVILSGGAGSRLWPLSRETYPKQLIALVDEYTLLQATVRRLTFLDDLQPPIVVCNEEHRFMVAEQLQTIEITPAAILLEPAARNTAPAIATAALDALGRCDKNDEAILLVMPTDHIVRDCQKFSHAVREAVQEAAANKLVAFGATPHLCGNRLRIYQGWTPHRR